MYKVFIADDEQYVVKSLMRSVNWEEYGFEVAASSNDGVDAYEEIISLRPQLVFADIRMPGMSGLELIKKAKKALNGTLFVVISGYAEFAYAQKAMSYGAIGYCVKPFDEDEIVGLLKKARDMLDKSNYEELDIFAAVEEQDAENRAKLKRVLEHKGLDLEKGLCAAVSLGPEKLLFERDTRYVAIKAGSSRYLYFFQCKNQRDYGADICSPLPAEVKGVGISATFHCIDDLKRNMEEATVLAYHYFVTGEKGIYRKKENEYAENMLKEFEKTVVRMDIEAMDKLLENAQARFRQGDLNIKHAMSIYNIYITFSSHFFETDRYDDYIYSFDQLCASFKNSDGLIGHIKEDMHNFIKRREGFVREEIKNEYFKKLVEYVDQNFYKDISIQSLSREFVINPNYISQLFRKNTGMTFTDYVTRLRIDYSSELLKKTNFSIDEVAGKCGYTDYFYFIRVFKKITGRSPGQFRHMEAERK